MKEYLLWTSDGPVRHLYLRLSCRYRYHTNVSVLISQISIYQM